MRFSLPLLFPLSLQTYENLSPGRTQKDAPPFMETIRTKRCFAVPPYFACTLRYRPHEQINVASVRRCNGRTQRSLLFPISRPAGRSNSLFSVRISGKAFAKLPRALPPTGRSLCGTDTGYSCPVIEYDEILSQPFFPVKRDSAIFCGVTQRITMFLHSGQVYAHQGVKWFSKRDNLSVCFIKMKERMM